jgi:anti-sigma factor RsiW
MTANDQNLHDSNDELLIQAEEMIWSLLDDNLPPAEAPRLEKMIEENGEVRARYLECVQLHADLTGHFATDTELKVPKLPASSDPPVLGSLGDIAPGVDAGPPVAE